jgi:ribosome-associated protein
MTFFLLVKLVEKKSFFWYNSISKKGDFMKEFIVRDQMINLTQFLKAEGLIYSGGEAKEYIDTHTIMLNGVRVYEKRKKMFVGDKVIIDNQEYNLVA